MPAPTAKRLAELLTLTTGSQIDSASQASPRQARTARRAVKEKPESTSGSEDTRQAHTARRAAKHESNSGSEDTRPVRTARRAAKPESTSGSEDPSMDASHEFGYRSKAQYRDVSGSGDATDDDSTESTTAGDVQQDLIHREQRLRQMLHRKRQSDVTPDCTIGKKGR